MAPQPSKSDSNEVNQTVAPPDLLTRRKIVMRNAGLPLTSQYSACHELLCEQIRKEGFVPSKAVTFAVQVVCHPLQKTPVPIESENELMLLGETRFLLQRLLELHPDQQRKQWKYLVNAATRYPALYWYLMHHVRHGLGFSPAQVHSGITDPELPRIMMEMFTSTPWDAAQLSLHYWISCESDEIRIFQGKRDRAVLEKSAGTHGLLPAPAVRSILRSPGSEDAVENEVHAGTSVTRSSSTSATGSQSDSQSGWRLFWIVVFVLLMFLRFLRVIMVD